MKSSTHHRSCWHATEPYCTELHRLFRSSTRAEILVDVRPMPAWAQSTKQLAVTSLVAMRCANPGNRAAHTVCCYSNSLASLLDLRRPCLRMLDLCGLFFSMPRSVLRGTGREQASWMACTMFHDLQLLFRADEWQAGLSPIRPRSRPSCATAMAGTPPCVVPRDIDYRVPFAARQPSVPCLCSQPPACRAGVPPRERHPYLPTANGRAIVSLRCGPSLSSQTSSPIPPSRPTLGNLSVLGSPSGAARQVQKPCSPWSPTRSKLIAWPSAEAPEPCRFL